MTKKIFIITIIAILILTLGAFGYLYWKNKNKPDIQTEAIENLSKTTEKINESATKGVLPSIQTNPLENKPDINPVDKTNPYKNIKTNPFE